jgi:Zn-dependent protease
MRWSYKIATLFGIPIRVHISLVLFLGLMAAIGDGLAGLVLMTAVFGSVVLHELGHALVARAKGLPIADISLYPFGGMARLMAAPRTTSDEIQVAVAGPLVSIVLGLGFWGLAAASGSNAIWLLAEVNLLLGAFNLLPALPMDGGRIFRALLARKQGYYRATRLSARLARWLALGLAVAGVFLSGWLIVMAVFLMFMSTAEEGLAQARQYMGDPGYQDAPGPHGPSQAAGSDWEVLDPEDSGPRTRRRVVTDRFGHRVIIEWRQP